MTDERIEKANQVLDDVREATDPFTMLVVWQAVKTFISPILIIILSAMIVSYARTYTAALANNLLAIGLVTFVGLVLGFLLARAVWQLLERRYHGLALLQKFFAVARGMADLRRLIKQQKRGEYVPTDQFDEYIVALDARARDYLAALDETGLRDA